MPFMRKSFVTIRLAYHGCANRPFFYIVATKRRTPRNRKYFEQIGTYDPLPNKDNEKLVSLNMDRLKYWLSTGAEPSIPVSQLLGLAGILPIYISTILKANINKQAAERRKQEQLEAAEEHKENEVKEED